MTINGAKKVIVAHLREIAQRIEDNTCHLTDEELLAFFSSLDFRELTKERAYQFLNISRSKFDRLLSDGVIPRGHKRLGSRELRWYVSELSEVLDKMESEKNDS